MVVAQVIKGKVFHIFDSKPFANFAVCFLFVFLMLGKTTFFLSSAFIL